MTKTTERKRRDEIISTIAAKSLGIETLDLQGFDDADFYDCHVTSISEALKAAYEAGRRATKETVSNG